MSTTAQGWSPADVLKALAAERLAHAETRARAEKAEAGRDRLWSALEEVACATEAADDEAAYRALTEARALLGEVKP